MANLSQGQILDSASGNVFKVVVGGAWWGDFKEIILKSPSGWEIAGVLILSGTALTWDIDGPEIVGFGVPGVAKAESEVGVLGHG